MVRHALALLLVVSLASAAHATVVLVDPGHGGDGACGRGGAGWMDAWGRSEAGVEGQGGSLRRRDGSTL